MSDKKYTVETENLAVPEVHTEDFVPEKTPVVEDEIEYDNLAIPEVHIKKMEK